MWGRIALFELRYQLRRPITLISFLIFLLLALGQATAGAFNNSGSIYANAPLRIIFAHAAFSILAMFLSVATIADVALRDAQSGIDAILRTKPVNRAFYLSARFAGAFAVASIALSGVTLGLLVGNHASWLPPGVTASFRAAPYFVGLFAVAIPNLFVTSALFFAVAAFSRSLLATYLAALAFFILYIVLQALLANPAYRGIAALADPFGQQALYSTLYYWSNAERNTLVPVGAMLLWNRFIWITFGLAMLAVALAFFDAVATRRRAPKVELPKAAVSPVMRERPRIKPGGAGTWDQFLLRTRFETRTILRSWTFIVLLVLMLAACIGLLAIGEQMQTGMRSYPVTYIVIDYIAAALSIAALLVPIAYAGELVWRDRATRIAAIVDVTPTPTAVFVLSKVAAVAAAILVLSILLGVMGVAYQWMRGVTDINLTFYTIKLLAVIGLPSLMFGVLALFVQTIVNQKYVALLIVIALVITLPLLSLLGVENNLFVLFHVPDVPLSDMNQYGHYLAATLWFALYWSCIAALILIAASLLWVRGTGSLWMRIRQSRQAINPAVASLAGVMLAGAAASGGYIYWNTHIRNEFITTSQAERRQVDYEKAYRAKENDPQPKIAHMEIAVDLFPSERGFRSRGQYTLVNRTDKPIENVHVVVAADKGAELALEGADATRSTVASGVFEFRPRTPFLPGETRTLTFSLADARPGFQTGTDVDTSVVYNGSFARYATLAPLIGVQSGYYLQAWTRRRAYGLEPLPAMARRDDAAQRRHNFISRDADFLQYTITVSTEADQIALAPGNLEREWTEGGRKFFRYSVDTPVINFWAVVSGRYAVTRDKWKDVELAVYYEPRHGQNVQRMLESMKEALAYYTENFGPFPHRQLRIAEFPRYASFAQSFPTLVPYSESIGFIADVRDENRIDFVWYVTAHEVAHQWWAHQVTGAAVEGAQFLSESLSEYSALMVAEKRYGPHRMRTFLKHSLDQYLSARGGRSDERPLARAVLDQYHVHYQKGSLTLYALRDAIGEAKLNGALKRLLREQKYKSDPYPTSADLIAILREEAGLEYKEFVADLFERITLWDLRTSTAQVTQNTDGSWRVRLDVTARKMHAKANGEETEAPLDQPIDIGLFATDPASSAFKADDVILLEKRSIKSGAQTLEFTVSRKPAFAGIDPYIKLISRNTSRNVVPLTSDSAKPM